MPSSWQRTKFNGRYGTTTIAIYRYSRRNTTVYGYGTRSIAVYGYDARNMVVDIVQGVWLLCMDMVQGL